ncbi:hypothetical protein C8J57DRAFT_1496750 [Mycena rebaudengoi]|nr:hypothetical protein C8J57DRAFT_1496750 [Mycena rebaudengoi]
MASYPPPKQYPPLLPIFPPPHSALPAVLPSIPQRSDFSPRFTVSTHLVPGAHLRCTPPVATPPPPPDKEHREARAQWVRRGDCTAARDGMSEFFGARSIRYLPVRKSDSPPTGNGLTLFLAHANGFPKETWEPMLLDLLDTPGGALIDEVWAWEATHHGASFIINAAAGTPACELCGPFLDLLLCAELSIGDWGDDTRDVLNFLMHFLPSEIGTRAAPASRAHTPGGARPPTSALGSRKRTLLAHAAPGPPSHTRASSPHSCSSTPSSSAPYLTQKHTPALGTPSSTAPSRGAIPGPPGKPPTAAFAANPFFAAWDPRVLAAYVAHGLVPSAPPATGVQLAMSRMQEALVFAGSDTSAFVWDLLPTLEERVELRFVVPGREGAPELGKPGSTAERVWRRPENASNVRMPSAGHLIVQEAPRDLAHEISQFVEKKYGPVKAHL